VRRRRILVVGGQGPVSAPLVRRLAPDNDVIVAARFSDPAARQGLEDLGVTCIRHDLFGPVNGLPDDVDHVFHSAMPMARDAAGMSRTDPPERGPWPESFDTYADATGRLLAHCRPAHGFVFASTISVYEPPGSAVPVTESQPFGVHTTAAYAFTKVANEAIISHLSRALDIPATILRVGSASGADGGPMRTRLDQIVAGRPVRVRPDGPTYVRPMFQPDVARLGVAALEAGRVPPLVVNFCGEDVVSVEEYCSHLGALVGRPPVFEPSADAWGSMVPDTALMHEVLGRGDVRWRDGCRRLVEQCYPTLLVS
jgi:nucleoside-diphosphate-sugar epimerase